MTEKINIRNFEHVYKKQLFNSYECREIDALSKELSKTYAGTGSAGNNDYTIRKAIATSIHLSEKTDWLHKKIADFVNEANKNWQFNLKGFYEPLQHLTYSVGGHYKYHTDSCGGIFSMRKISFVAFLSSRSSYSGGLIEFPTEGETSLIQTQGMAVAFPSYLAHRVTPVESGLRKTLVAWISGEPFT